MAGLQTERETFAKTPTQNNVECTKWKWLLCSFWQSSLMYAICNPNHNMVFMRLDLVLPFVPIPINFIRIMCRGLLSSWANHLYTLIIFMYIDMNVEWQYPAILNWGIDSISNAMCYATNFRFKRQHWRFDS